VKLNLLCFGARLKNLNLDQSFPKESLSVSALEKLDKILIEFYALDNKITNNESKNFNYYSK
jgi:hypothetical protein